MAEVGTVIIIAAMGSNRVIGQGAGMPWNVPDEYDQFLRLIGGQTVIIGRRSWQIFGADLTSVHNIVVSRSVNEIDGATVVNGVDAALETARGFGKTVFSAGGAEIYRQTVPLAEKMFISVIKGEFKGDAFFPAFDKSEWAITERKKHPAFDFVAYERKSP